MNPKIMRILTIVMTVLAAGMAILSGVMKLTQSAQVVEGLSKVGVGSYIIPLGLMEIGFAALFLYSKTMKLGFILLSCYFAGALATELSHGTPFNAVLPLVLIWIAAFLRDKTIFLPTQAKV